MVLLAVATAQASVLATQDFEGLNLGSLKTQAGGTGWKTGSTWYSSATPSPFKDWLVETGAGDQYIRSVGATAPTGYRHFCPTGTLTAPTPANNLLVFRMDVALDGTTLGNLNARLIAAESTSGADRRLDVQFNADGGIYNFVGATPNLIARWDGGSGYADARNRTFQTLEMVLDLTAKTIQSASWGGANLPLAAGQSWRVTTDSNVTSLNLLGGQSLSSDPAVPGGIMLDNVSFETLPEPATLVLLALGLPWLRRRL